jgi:hypothetical protein
MKRAEIIERLTRQADCLEDAAIKAEKEAENWAIATEFREQGGAWLGVAADLRKSRAALSRAINILEAIPEPAFLAGSYEDYAIFLEGQGLRNGAAVWRAIAKALS